VTNCVPALGSHMIVEHNRVKNSALPLAINPHFTQVSPNRRVVESPWLQFISECQRFGLPPRLNH
jgi:hypothetical protein